MNCERQVPYAVMNYRKLVSEDFFRVCAVSNLAALDFHDDQGSVCLNQQVDLASALV